MRTPTVEQFRVNLAAALNDEKAFFADPDQDMCAVNRITNTVDHAAWELERAEAKAVGGRCPNWPTPRSEWSKERFQRMKQYKRKPELDGDGTIA